jgi:Fic family protein
MKVAILLASIDWANQSEREKFPRVRLSHWYQGQAIAETWRESVHRLLNEFATGDEQNQEENLLRILRRSSPEGMTAREIGQLAHIKREIVDNQLLALEQDGLVERVPNSGRRAITYRIPVKV